MRHHSIETYKTSFNGHYENPSRRETKKERETEILIKEIMAENFPTTEENEQPNPESLKNNK